MSDTATPQGAASSEPLDEVQYDPDPNAHNRVEPADRGPGMDEPVHYTYARPEEKPAGRDTRLVDAVKAQDRTLVVKLLDEGCAIHQRAEQDWTPLNFAAGKGDLGMVELLVERGADVTVVGRDQRRPSAIARAAGHKKVLEFLTGIEKRLGVWEDPLNTRPYCKAYYLRDLRKFSGWAEERKNWKINRYWSEAMKADFEKPLEDADVVFVHHDLVVTRSMWRDEHVIYDAITPAWQEFCHSRLGFRIPDDLR